MPTFFLRTPSTFPQGRSAPALLLSIILVLGARPAFPQAQPGEAVNNQDEQVNLNKEVDGQTSQFTIFRSGDKAEINHYVSEVVELKHAAAFEVLPHVLKAVKREKGDARPLKYKDPQSGETRYFMQVVTTPDQMPSVIETIHALDLPEMTSSSGDLYYHYRLKYRRASEVASIVGATTLSGEGEISADDATNTVFFKDSQSDGERNLITMKFYDVPPPQVEFDVLAVEIEEDNAREVGLDWDAWKNAVGGQFELTGSRFEGGESFARLDGLLTVDATALASFLNYIAQEGTGRVVTRTRVTASNNTPGIVSSLRRVASPRYERALQDPKELTEETPGFYSSNTGDFRDTTGKRPVAIVPPARGYRTDAGNPLAPGASAIDPSLLAGAKGEGVFLVIQPTIGTDMVTADIRVVVNSLAGLTRLDEPIVSERLLHSTVTLRDGEPFSLGGLDKETTVQVRRGIPGLKDIPVLKYLFGVEKEQRRRSKIYLSITPAFRNQVVFSSPALLSCAPEREPMVEVNPRLPRAETTGGEMTEASNGETMEATRARAE